MSESPETSSPSPPPPGLSGPKRYRPPRPDANTFDTQKEFLDSLHPVAIDTLASNNMRCPHCWKDYGQSDAGLDNAEQPVKLRCGHVFGEKCLKEALFPLPTTVKIDLVPLSYGPGSKGADLGARLSAWVEQCGVEKGALLLGGNREKDFTKLLTEFHERSNVDAALGTEWGAVLLAALATRSRVERVHIMENAVVFDTAPASKAMLETAYYSPPPNFSGGPLSMFTSLPSFHSLVGEPGPWASAVSPETAMFDFDYSEGPFSSSAPLFLGASGNHPDAAVLFSSTSGHHSDPGVSNGTESVSSSKADCPAPGKSAPEGSTDDIGINYAKATPKKKSPKKTSAKMASKNLKSPSAETKSVTDAEVEAAKAKLDELLKKLDDPSMTTFIPYQLVQKMAEISPENNPHETVPAHPPSASQALMSMMATGLCSAEDIKAGKFDAIEKLQNNVKSSWYAEAQKKTQTMIKAAEKSKAAYEAQQQAAEKRARKAKEERELMRKEIITHLATALKAIYEEYERSIYTQALDAGQPPPIKKLRLASSNTKPAITSKAIATVIPNMAFTGSPDANVVHVSVTVHMRDMDAKGYEVPQPYVYPCAPLSNDENEDENEDGGDEAADFNPTGKTFFLTRTRCATCPLPKTATTGFSVLPEFITWKNAKKVTDDCPLCRRVLFRKENKRDSRRIHE